MTCQGGNFGYCAPLMKSDDGARWEDGDSPEEELLLLMVIVLCHNRKREERALRSE